ncbi:MAG: hypothetical protein HYV60_00210 [Planctomycetia bacterium]|nr:hypothetical protein [Planctomycetia bacterium]
MARTFHHIGLPTHEPQPNETYVADTKVWVTDPADHPYRVEFLRFEDDSPVTGPLRDMPHVFTPMPGLSVAFVKEYGAVVEFMKFEGDATEFAHLK